MTELKYDEFTNCLCYDNDANFLKWRILFPPKLHSNKLYRHRNLDLNATMPTIISSPSNHKRKFRNNRNALRYKTQPITFDEIIEADEDTVTDINNNNNNNDNNNNNNNNNKSNNMNNMRMKKEFPPFKNRCSLDAHMRTNWNIPEVDENNDVTMNPETAKAERENAEEMEKAWERRRSLRLMRNSVVEEEGAEVEW